ncbi:HflX-like GTP-binding protein [Streptomyces sp. NPDC005141]
MLVGYFSAKERNFVDIMDAAAAELTARGARIVGRTVQRRGVSGGGVKKMALPYSSRTLLSSGKVREVAAACAGTDADAVVFVASLTERQRRVLTEILGRPAVSLFEGRHRAEGLPAR